MLLCPSMLLTLLVWLCSSYKLSPKWPIRCHWCDTLSSLWIFVQNDSNKYSSRLFAMFRNRKCACIVFRPGSGDTVLGKFGSTDKPATASLENKWRSVYWTFCRQLSTVFRCTDWRVHSRRAISNMSCLLLVSHFCVWCQRHRGRSSGLSSYSASSASDAPTSRTTGTDIYAQPSVCIISIII